MKNKLVSNSIIFTGMTILQRGIAFLLLPLYTGILSPEQYGITNMITSVCAVYILIFSLAMDDTVARLYFQYRQDKGKLKEVLGTLIIISVLVSVAGGVLLFGLNSLFLRPFLIKMPLYPNIILGLVPVVCTSVYNILQKILIIEEKAFHYSINTMIFFIINTVLTILFIVNMKMGATGLLLASAITYLLFFVYSIVYLLPKISIVFNIEVAKDGLKYGLVLLPNRIASWGLTYINKIVLGNFISAAMVGIYNISLTFSGIVSIFANCFSFALQPWIYKQLENGEKGKDNIISLTNVISIIFCFGGLGISLFSKEVIMFVINKRYFGSIYIIPILVLGEVLSAYSTLFVYVLFYYKNMTKYVTISTIVGCALNVGLSFILIPYFGIAGSAIAVIVGEFAIGIIKTVYSIKALKISINIIPMYLLAFFCMICALLAQYYEVSLLIKSLFFIILFAGVILLYKKQIEKFLRALQAH